MLRCICVSVGGVCLEMYDGSVMCVCLEMCGGGSVRCVCA